MYCFHDYTGNNGTPRLWFWYQDQSDFTYKNPDLTVADLKTISYKNYMK
jgi:hypothetical protein